MAGPGEGAGGADNSKSFLPALGKLWDWYIEPSRRGLRSNTRLSPAAPEVSPSRLTGTGDADSGIGGGAAPGPYAFPRINEGALGGGPPPPPGQDPRGHWEAAGPNGEYVYVKPDGTIAVDLDTGIPIMVSNKSAGGGGDGTAGQMAADRAERARQFDITEARARDEFQRTYDRRSFESDRAYQQAEDQFVKTFVEQRRQFDVKEAEDTRQFDVGERNRLTVAANQEQGENARFGAQYGLSAANAENEYNQSMYQTDVADALNRYSAETARQARLSELALQRDAQAREILRNPSDALARLFFTRGGTSPQAFVSQADLLNRLSGQIVAATPGALPAPVARPTFIRPAPFQAPPSMLTPLTQAPQAAAPTQTSGNVTNDAIRNFFANAGGPVQGTVAYDAAQAAGYVPPPPGRYANGSNGFVRERLSVVGDMPSGKGGNPEAVINPTNAPLAVVPLKSHLSAPSEKESGVEDKAELRAIKAKSAALPHIEDAELAHRMVDDIAAHRGRLSSVPHHALGTISLGAGNDPNNPYLKAGPNRAAGTYGYIKGGQSYDWDYPSQGQFAAFTAPASQPAATSSNAAPISLALPPQTQEDIVNTARQATGPAGQAFLTGGNVDDLRFTDYTGAQQALPSAIQYGRLTASEKENLIPRLAAEYNMTLQDLTDQLTARYGGTRSRREARLSLR